MEPDKFEKRILKRALVTPGLFLRELYRPFTNERSETFLWKKVKCLESCGFLKIDDTGSTCRVYATPKTKRLFKAAKRAKK